MLLAFDISLPFCSLICIHCIILNFLNLGFILNFFILDTIYTILNTTIYTMTGTSIPPLLYLHLYWEYSSQQYYLHLDYEHFSTHTLGKPFPPDGFSTTNTEGCFLGTLPFGLGCAVSTTFGIPASSMFILFLSFITIWCRHNI